jgi:hypothetical protein
MLFGFPHYSFRCPHDVNLISTLCILISVRFISMFRDSHIIYYEFHIHLLGFAQYGISMPT